MRNLKVFTNIKSMLFKKDKSIDIVFRTSKWEYTRTFNYESPFKRLVGVSIFNMLDIIKKIFFYTYRRRIYSYLYNNPYNFSNILFSMRIICIVRSTINYDNFLRNITRLNIFKSFFCFNEQESTLCINFNLLGMSMKKIVNRLDVLQNQNRSYIHERLNKKLYYQVLRDVIPLKVRVFDRNLDFFKLGAFFRKLNKLNSLSILGYNTSLINTMYIFLLNFYFFFYSFIIQLIFIIFNLLNKYIYTLKK